MWFVLVQKPIGMVDHLQFGNPEDPENFFGPFMESIEGITDYAKINENSMCWWKSKFL